MWLRLPRLLALIGWLGEVRATVLVAWRLLVDIRVPLPNKLIVPLVVAYFVWPLDFVPDFIPFLGQMDDLTVIVTGMLVFIRLCPPRLVAEHRADVRVPPRARASKAGGDVIEGQFRVLDDDRRD